MPRVKYIRSIVLSIRGLLVNLSSLPIGPGHFGSLNWGEIVFASPDDAERFFEVVEMVGDPLIGVDILRGFRLLAEMIEDGVVPIEAL